MPYTDAIKFNIVFSSNPYIGAPSVQKNKEAPELMLMLMQIRVFNCIILIHTLREIYVCDEDIRTQRKVLSYRQ